MKQTVPVCTLGRIAINVTTADKNQGNTYHIIGVLDKDHALQYDTVNGLRNFIFFARDKNGITKKVVFRDMPPADFDKSKQLALTGYIKDSIFYCDKIQIRG